MSDPLDDLIRERMRDSYPLGHASTEVLSQLSPRLERARSVNRAMRATAGVSGAAVVLVAALLIVPQFGGSPTHVDLAGLPGDVDGIADTDGSKTVESPTATDGLGRTIAEPEDDLSPEPTDTTAAGPTSAAEPSTTAPPATTTAPTSTNAPTTTTTAQPTTSTQSTSSAPTTTEPPTTTTSAGPITTVETSCGNIEVELVGSGIQLIATHPDSGVEVEVRDAGPDEVEVRFENESIHCEVLAENRDGQVWSVVSEE